jgi:hypothetical protein
MKAILFFLIVSFFSSCSCELTDLIFTKSMMLSMAQKEDPNVEVIIPRDITGGVKCSSYDPGCTGAFQAKVRGVEIVLVEFENEEQAYGQAFKIGQYYSKNWVFDDVTGEPVLEKFITKVYNAKKARDVKKEK